MNRTCFGNEPGGCGVGFIFASLKCPFFLFLFLFSCLELVCVELVSFFLPTVHFGTSENSRKRTFISCVCQTVVEGISADQAYPQHKAGKDLCTGL